MIILEKNYDSGILNENILAELERKKIALEKLYNYQVQGAYIRSRAKYKIEGERPTKLFCNLEKYNGVQKFVPQLIIKCENNEDKLINDQKSVEKEIFTFYRDLYKNKDNTIGDISIEQFLSCNNTLTPPKVFEKERQPTSYTKLL